MSPETTAVLLIGYQNDYFAPDGVLRSALEDGHGVDGVRERTSMLLDGLHDLPTMIVSTPIAFTSDYRELVDPVGILALVKSAGAFKRGTEGGATITDLAERGSRILEVPGKRGLNAFPNTALEHELRARGVTDVVIAGVVTSICVDSTARSAHDKGFTVHVLSDCTAGRTRFEQDFYCREVFPLYATVMTSVELLEELAGSKAALTPG